MSARVTVDLTGCECCGNVAALCRCPRCERCGEPYPVRVPRTDDPDGVEEFCGVECWRQWKIEEMRRRNAAWYAANDLGRLRLVGIGGGDDND